MEIAVPMLSHRVGQSPGTKDLADIDDIDARTGRQFEAEFDWSSRHR
jgi:hypothetical protein